MRNARTRRLATLTAGLLAATFLNGTPANANDTLNSTDIAAALAGVGDRLVTATSGISDVDSIADNGTIDIRRDGTIHFRTKNAGDVVITLPYAKKAEAANGGVTYRNANSATVARLTVTGAQALLVAANESAPTEYPFLVSNGYVSNSSAGGLMLLDHNGSLVMPIPKPWAKDAKGGDVPTQFVADVAHTSFMQVVAHKAEMNYPVVADPLYYWYPAGLKIVLGINATATLAASAIFLPIVAGFAYIGAIVLNNKLLWKAGQLQIQAAWLRTQNQCLWIWVPYVGDVEYGGYPC